MARQDHKLYSLHSQKTVIYAWYDNVPLWTFGQHLLDTRKQWITFLQVALLQRCSDPEKEIRNFRFDKLDNIEINIHFLKGKPTRIKPVFMRNQTKSDALAF